MLHFYDASATVHLDEFKLYALPHPPTCLCYLPSDDNHPESMLMFGDSRGGIGILRFQQPDSGLFAKCDTEGVTCVSWPVSNIITKKIIHLFAL